MKSFEYAAPKTIKDAVALLEDRWGSTEILAGGTDLVTCLKQELTQPQRVVSLRNIPDLKGIQTRGGSARIGATTTLRELTRNAAIRERFPSLVTAAEAIGSPQLLNVGTVGGDLCQRPRCWYFRNGFGLFGEHENASLIKSGDNRYHAIFGNEGRALFVSASSLAPALIALRAEVTITGPKGTRKVEAANFFHTPANESERETVLHPNEILTEITLSNSVVRSATYEVRHRHGLDWPYVTASVAFELKNGVVNNAEIVLGHVAPVPWRSAAAASTMNGSKVDEASAARCAEAAVSGAHPLSGNAYKLPMVRAAVKRALLAAAQA